MPNLSPFVAFGLFSSMGILSQGGPQEDTYSVRCLKLDREIQIPADQFAPGFGGSDWAIISFPEKLSPSNASIGRKRIPATHRKVSLRQNKLADLGEEFDVEVKLGRWTEWGGGGMFPMDHVEIRYEFTYSSGLAIVKVPAPLKSDYGKKDPAALLQFTARVTQRGDQWLKIYAVMYQGGKIIGYTDDMRAINSHEAVTEPRSLTEEEDMRREQDSKEKKKNQGPEPVSIRG